MGELSQYLPHVSIYYKFEFNHELHESHEFYINAKFNFFVKFVRFVVLKTSYWW